jgi:hypothetical protein
MPLCLMILGETEDRTYHCGTPQSWEDALEDAERTWNIPRYTSVRIVTEWTGATLWLDGSPTQNGLEWLGLSEEE